MISWPTATTVENALGPQPSASAPQLLRAIMASSCRSWEGFSNVLWELTLKLENVRQLDREVANDLDDETDLEENYRPRFDITYVYFFLTSG